MRFTRVLLVVILLDDLYRGAFVGAGQSATPRRGGNPEAAKIANPVKPAAESIAAGRRTYARLCVRCHGPEGKGDGGGAGAGGQPADFTDDAWDFGASDGEIFIVIRDGTSADMDAYGERIKETEIWELVGFIKSLGPRRNQP
jgi:mono/diheme cytochrome c family protein